MRCAWVRAATAIVAIVMVVTAGCTPSPRALCEHTTDVVEKQFGPDDPTHAEQSHEKGVVRCTEIWSTKKKENAAGYECYAKCAMDTKQVVELGACRPRCFPNEPKPPDEPDNVKGLFWSPDASSG